MSRLLRLPALLPTLRSLRAAWPPSPRVMIGAAWFFILFSLAHLAWVIGVKWVEPAGLTTLYQTTVDTAHGDVTHRAWGLAYDGVPGLLLAILQAAVVSAAAFLSVLETPKLRRLGHGILIAWSGLWTVNLLHLAGLDHLATSYAQAGLMTSLFAATVYRAMHRPAARTEATEPASEPAPGTPGLPDETLASPAGDPSASDREDHASRWRDRLGRVTRQGRHGAKRFAAAARPAREGVQAAGRRLTRWLRDHAVLPRRGTETS